MVGVYRNGGVVQFTQPYQGKYHRNLEPDEFLELVGKPALAETYRSKRKQKIGLLVASGAAWVAGFTLFTVGLTANLGAPSLTCNSMGCVQADNGGGGTPLIILGALVGATGLGLGIAGFATDTAVVSGSEARQYADEYNTRLRQNLGLATPRAQLDDEKAPSMQLSLAPVLTANEKGVALRLVF